MRMNRRQLLSLGSSATLAAPFLIGPNRVVAKEAVSSAGLVPRFAKHRVGDATVTVLLDGVIDAGPDIIIGFDQQAADETLRRQHIPGFNGTRPLPIMGHVIDTGDRKIAIDCGTLPGFSPKTGGYHEALKQAGIDPAEIDTVLITHLHPDHIGGLSAGEERLFPNAEIVVNETEWAFWTGAAADALPDQVQPFVQIARGFTAPYADRLRLFKGEVEVLPGLQSVQLPGHTPGHVGFHLSNNGDDLLFWGDLIHLPRLQFDHPEWLVAFDMDPDQTVATRSRMLDMVATDGLKVTGAHLEFPGFGYVDRAAGRYDFVAAEHDYTV